MLTTNTAPRFYAACLASYNNGVLHGAWIDASTDVDEMREEIAAMLRASKFPNVTVECPETGEDVPSAEEYAIHDHEGLGQLGEYDSLETIAAIVDVLEEFDHMDSGDLAAILGDYSDPSEAAEALRDNFAGIYDTFKDYSDEAAEEMIACHSADGKTPQALINYFDYDAWSRDLAMEMHTIDVPSGVAVFHA